MVQIPGQITPNKMKNAKNYFFQQLSLSSLPAKTLKVNRIVMKSFSKLYLSCRFRLLHSYEGCLLYFGISEQKQTLIIENRFIVFQNMPQ